MRAGLALVVWALLGVFAGSASADFQYAELTNNSGSVDNGTVSNPNGGEGAPDNSFFTLTLDADGTAVLRMRVRFANAVDNPGITLYGVSVSSGATATVTQLRWSDNGTAPGTTVRSVDSNNITLGSPITLSAGTNYFSDGFNQFTSSGATPVSGFTAGTFTHAFIQFRLTGLAGATLRIDAVSNPEPGTIALFALGAAGLGVVVGRRQRARAARRRATA